MVYGQHQMQAARTSPWAIAAFVCGIVGLCGVGPLASIPAVIFGHKARREIRRTGEGGWGLAKAGLIIAYISLTLFAAAILIAVAMNHAAESMMNNGA